MLGYPRKLPDSLTSNKLARLVCILCSDSQNIEWRCLHVTAKGAVSKVQVADMHMTSKTDLTIGCTAERATVNSDGFHISRPTTNKEHHIAFCDPKFPATVSIDMYHLHSSVTTLFLVGTAPKGYDMHDVFCQGSLYLESAPGITDHLGVFRKRHVHDANTLVLVVLFYCNELWWVQALGKTYQVPEQGEQELLHPHALPLPPHPHAALEQMVPYWLDTLKDPGSHPHEVALGGNGPCTEAEFLLSQHGEVVIHQEAVAKGDSDWYIDSD